MKSLLSILILAVLGGPLAHAHSFSSSFLTIDNRNPLLHSEWLLSLQDLELALGLDANQDGRISWGELRGHRADIEAYGLSRLIYVADHATCRHVPHELLVDTRRDVPYAVLRFDSVCNGASEKKSIHVTYGALLDVDPQHRGFINLVGKTSATAMVRAETPTIEIGATGTTLAAALTYVQEGVWHIWSGFDHLLFLLTLLLGVTCAAAGRPVWKDTLVIVTAFTVAHSITLVLGSLHVVSVSSYWIELIIAASIAVAAIANLLPLFEPYRSALALGFGLIHGFGFAGVLEDMALSGKTFAAALVSFNIGVEIGQLAIVAAFIAVSRAWLIMGADPTKLKRIGSMAIAGAGIVWAVYRAAG